MMRILVGVVGLLVAGCSGGTTPTDATSTDATDVATLTAQEMALVGTWTKVDPWTADASFHYALLLRADHTSRLTVEIYVNTCGAATTYVMERSWRVMGNAVVFGAAPHCDRTDSTTCMLPAGTTAPSCMGPDMGGSYTYSLAGTSLMLASGSNGDDGTYTRQ